MSKRIIIALIGLVVFATSVSGQDHVDDHNHPEHVHDDHSAHTHHRNELGIAIAPVHFIKEGETSFGLHLHYIHNLANSKFGVGLGYERVFDDHEHHTFGVVGSYRPIERLAVNLSPGLTYEGAEEGAPLNFALHLETAYEFEVDDLHIGPVLEFAYDQEDYHVALGIHIGFGF